MSHDEKSMIEGLPFEAAAKEIGTVIAGLQAIQQAGESKAVRSLATEALPYMSVAASNIDKAQSVMNGKMPEERTMEEAFIELRQAVRYTLDAVGFEFAGEADEEKLADIDQAKILLQDASEIVERAASRAAGAYKGRKVPRVVLRSMGELFTVDATAPNLRYCGIPAKNRK